MAVLFMDSFQHYLTADIGKKWTGVTAGTFGTEVQIGATSGNNVFPGGIANVLFTNATNNRGIFKTVANTVTGIGGVWFYLQNNLPGTSTVLMGFADAGTLQVDVRGDGNGHLIITRNGTTLATSTRTITTNTWYHLELKTTINNTTGVIQLKINGEDWIASTSGLNTRATANNFFNQLQMANTNVAGQTYRDVYLLDTSGAVANDFIGPCRIAVMRPAGAGNYSQWTPQTGKNHGTVQEYWADGDTSWNSTTGAGNIDTFKMLNVPAGTVYGVQHVIEARQDAGAARTMAPLQRIAGTDYAGTAVGLTASHAFYTQVYTLSPATSAQWTTAEINGAEFGYKLVT